MIDEYCLLELHDGEVDEERNYDPLSTKSLSIISRGSKISLWGSIYICKYALFLKLYTSAFCILPNAEKNRKVI